MKKFLALLLAVMMIASMSVTAFAVENDYLEATTAKSTAAKGEVKVISANNNLPTDPVYYVEIQWQELNFTFTFNNAANIQWNPQTHAYVDMTNADSPAALSGSWDKKKIDNAVVVKNHSDVDVTVTAQFDESDSQEATAVNNIGAKIATTDDATLKSAVGVANYNDADAVHYTVSIGTSETLTEDVPSDIDDFKIATVVITFAA